MRNSVVPLLSITVLMEELAVSFTETTPCWLTQLNWQPEDEQFRVTSLTGGAIWFWAKTLDAATVKIIPHMKYFI
jgi:hypothetical protein